MARTVLVILIILALLFLMGDQLIYRIQTLVAPERCGEFPSAIILLNELEDGRVSSVNGVVVGNRTILSVSHAQSNTESLLLIGEDVIENGIEKIEIDPLRDIVWITVKEDLDIPIAALSSEMTGPFTLVPWRGNEIRSVFAGNNWALIDGNIVFRNGATIPGDSGAALLNSRCEVVAIVHGGSGSFLWRLRPTSEYVPLFE